MRVVLDVNVLIAALLSPAGSPARLLVAWREGNFDLLVSPLLLRELERALAYPKLRKRIAATEAVEYVEWLAQSAIVLPDPNDPPEVRALDPGDDYLVALAAASDAYLVSGDDHLLALSVDLPVHSPARFLAVLATREP